MGENYLSDPICDDDLDIVSAQPFSRIFMGFHDIQSSVSYFVKVVKSTVDLIDTLRGIYLEFIS